MQEWTKKNPEKVKKNNQKYYRNNLEKYKENHRKWREKNPAKSKEIQRRWREKKREFLAGRQKSSQCEICGMRGRICFDHNHNTGEFRGWICSKCNAVLGLVNDNPKLLQKIIEYLRQ